MMRRQICAFLLALATFALMTGAAAAAASSQYTPVTLPADSIRTNYALMHGTVSLDGKKGYVAFQIRRASARRFLGHTPWRRFGPGVTNVNFDVFAQNLLPDTEYVFRAVSYVRGVQRNGNSLTFRTLGRAVPPTIATLAASGITTDSAGLNGTVNPNGQAGVVWFEWGTTTNYGNVTAAQNVAAGLDPVPVLATLTGLAASTTYHYRLAGSNTAGLSRGADAQFATGVPATPAVVTLPASDLAMDAAVLNGSVNPSGQETLAWFEWGTTTNYGNATAAQAIPAGADPVPVLAALSGLAAGTTYHFRLAATNSAGLSLGVDMEFATTAPIAPTVVTLAASGLATDGAVLNGTLNPNGQPALAWFEWGTTTNYGNVTAVQNLPAGLNAVPVLATLSNLLAGTTYHFRIVGTNSAGLSLGADAEFVTVAPSAPTVVTLAASGQAVTSATLNGSVNPNNQPTLAWFEWGTTTNYGNATAGQAIAAGTSDVPVQAALANLAGNTTYFFRLMASNAGGLTPGNSISFNTLPATDPPVILTLTATNIAAASATLRASVNPNGAPTVVWFEWGSTMSYGNKTPVIPLAAGGLAVGVEATVNGLTANSIYHFRAVATNDAGSRAGANQVFVTSGANCRPEDSVDTIVNCTEADLRTAVTNARTVRFACEGVITLTSPIVVSCALRLDATGHSVVLSGGNTNRLFYVQPGAELELINLTVADGRVTGTNGLPATGPAPSQWGEAGESVHGGGIVVSNSTLRAVNCLFTNCSAVAGWGGDAASVNWGRGEAGDATGGLISAHDATVSLTNCTLAGNAAVAGWSGYGGYQEDPSRTPGDAFGGVMAAVNTSVSLVNCVVQLNSASSHGGAIDLSGTNAALWSGQNTFAGNTAGTVGGAINVQAGRASIAQNAFLTNQVLGDTYSSAYGGAFGMSGGVVEFGDCDFFGNACSGGNAVTSPIGVRAATVARGGAFAVLGGALSVSQSTFRGNAAYGGNGLDAFPSPGNPASAQGGAIYLVTTARITNSTFSGNLARAGSGPGAASGSSRGGAVAVASGNMVLASTTIASNTVSDINGSASSGAGLYRSAGTVSILSSLLAGNLANASVSQNTFGSFNDLGRNLSSDATPVWTSGTSLNNTDPLLGPLSDNGGFTFTFPLLPGSPAIDAADPLTSPATDQRGVARPQGPAPDIGSFERQ